MRERIAGLDVRFVGKPAAGKPLVVLLHGFGAPGEDLVPLAHEIDAPGGTCFAFPAAPIDMGAMWGDARAWWLIDVEGLMRDPRRDRTHEVPDGLAEARAQVTALCAALAERAGGPLVLGGFSQGAMLSCDVALHWDGALAGLVLMSGTLLARGEWEPRLPSRAGLRVLQSHGREDPILPYAAAEKLRDLLRGGGLVVDWIPFSGGHGIAPAVLERLGVHLHDACVTE
jgi:phospholipase/carboxylesterase